MTTNTQVLMASYPEGWVTEEHFRIVETPIPQPGHGEVLIRNHFLSLDPYMRGRMATGKSYAKGLEPGDVMVGGTVGEIMESRHANFKAGDFVVASTGWQTYGISDGTGLVKVDAKKIPLSAYLGVVGMPGVTAWTGLFEHCTPHAGETVVVSAASGAVGSVVGQLAKLQGCRAVGIAGGRDKCDYVVKELGFDACVDYKAGKLFDDLKAAAPKGIDCYFENVGGVVMDTVFRLLNPFARAALCGLISDYNSTQPYGFTMMRSILVNRVNLRGFIVSDRMDLYIKARQELIEWVSAGKIKYRESVAQGIHSAPKAFIGMLKGENFGKQVVKLI